MVSIIIRCRDEEKNIGKTLHMLFNQSVEFPFEVIVVDSGSTDRTLDIATQYNVKILHIPPQKFSYGYSLNYGIQNSSDDIICCLSAHCIPYDNNWLSELVKPIIEGRAHATYGRQIPVKGVNPFEELFLSKHFPENEKSGGRVSFSNANCAFIRKMWDEVKFDEQIPSWEDYLWYLLTKERFIFQYMPNAHVIHSHPFSFTRLARTAYQDGKAFRYIKNNYNLNILDRTSSLIGKMSYVMRDILTNALFFLKKGYLRYLLLLPFVKLYSYFNYWKGYRSNS